MKTAIYARVSKDDGTQDAENQLHELRSLAAANNWTVTKEYVDHMSGGRQDRPAFQQMMADAARRKYDLLLFWSLDRLSREGALATLQYLTQLSGYGVAYRSYQEAYLDSCGPLKDVVVSLMATIAKQERLRISERTKAGLRAAVRRGARLGRPAVDIDLSLIKRRQSEGSGLRAIAAETGWSLSAIMRARRAAVRVPQTIEREN